MTFSYNDLEPDLQYLRRSPVLITSTIFKKIKATHHSLRGSGWCPRPTGRGKRKRKRKRKRERERERGEGRSREDEGRTESALQDLQSERIVESSACSKTSPHPAQGSLGASQWAPDRSDQTEDAPEAWCWISATWCDLMEFPSEKAMAPHSSPLAWKIPWTGKPGRLQSMGSLGVRHDWAASLSLFTFMHWRRKWQPTPVFLPGESQGRGSLVGCCLWGCTESDTTGVT